MAEVKIVLNAVDNATGVLRGVGGIATGIFQGIGQAAFSAFGGLVSGAFDSVKSSMIDGNAEFERYQTQFGVLLGDAGLAKERLEDLAEFGAKTPFELPEVVRADKILQAFGLHAEDTAERFGFSGEEIRTIAGDVAAGTGASFEEISTYLGKFSSGATGDAISRMQELGIVTRKQLSEMGLEFSKSGELLTPVDDAMDVLLKSMQDKFGGMMDAQSSTFEGMMSNFQDFLGQAGRTLGAPFFDIAKKGLGRVLEILNDAKPVLEDFANAMGTFFGALTSGGGLRDAIDSLGEFEIFQGIFKTLGINIYDVSKAIDGLVNYFVAIVQSGDTLNDWLTNIPEPMRGIAQAAGEVLAAFQESMPMIQRYVADMLAFVQAQFASVSPVLVENVASTLNGIAEFWRTHGETIMAVVNGTFRIISATIAGALILITGMMDSFMLVLNGDWDGFWENQKQTLVAFFDTALAVVGTNLGEFLTVWQDVFLQLQIIIAEGITRGLDNLKSFGQAFVDLGVGLMQALAGGILQGVADAIASATGAAQAIVDAIKGTLGIQSPSRVFAGLGANMMAGMAQGISGSAMLPAYAAAGAAGAVYNSAVNATVNVNGAGDPRAVALEVRRQLDAMGYRADARARTGTGR